MDIARHIVFASYGNDSVALIQHCANLELSNVTVLYNDTGWARGDWALRVEDLERWARSLGFTPARTQSIGLEELVHRKKGWPRQGIQFCTSELKIKPTITWLAAVDPEATATCLIGVRRVESANRSNFPERVVASANHGGRDVWAPLVDFTDSGRDLLLEQAGVEPLPHRSMECFPCINSNRRDLQELAKDPARIDKIAAIEEDLGMTSKGKPRTMFRPYRYMGATGIREVVRWAEARHGQFDLAQGTLYEGTLDDGTGEDCTSGYCGL